MTTPAPVHVPRPAPPRRESPDTVLATLKEWGEPMTADEVATIVGRSGAVVHSYLVRLLERGAVVRERLMHEGRGSGAYRYRLAPPPVVVEVPVPEAAPAPPRPRIVPTPRELPELLSARAVLEAAGKIIEMNNYVAMMPHDEAAVQRMDDAVHDLLVLVADHQESFAQSQ